jgi:putative FmdB family regulatory protein
MPIFEYRCDACGPKFEAAVFGQQTPECTKCHTEKLDKQSGIDKMQVPNASGPTMIDGCLQSSGGHYKVVDNNGKVHNLTGDTARLSRYVGPRAEHCIQRRRGAGS